LFSSSIIENYENQIEQLQQNLSEKEDERISLAERLNQAELELIKTVDDYKSTLNSYQEKLKSLTQERNALTEQQALHSAEQ
jgi:flagellar biosynthesis chaperone FliJ